MSSRRKSGRFRKLAYLSIIWTVSLLVVLVAAEAILRLTSDGWDKANYMNVARNRTISFDVSGLYETSEPTVLYQRDEYGLRDDCSSPEDIDILAVGGSTTDERMVPFESSYPKVLEDDLGRALGRKVCVSNAGVSGHSTFGHIRAFRDWFPLIPGLKPKIFLFYIGINDSEFASGQPTAFDEGGEGLKGFFKRMEVVQLGLWLGNVMGSINHYSAGSSTIERSPDEYDRMEMTSGAAALADRNAEHFRKRLRILLAGAAEYGAEAVCVTQPHAMVMEKDGKRYGSRFMWDGGDSYNGLDYDYALGKINEVMLEECGEDRLANLYAEPIGNSDFYDYLHTTPSGSRRIGHALAEWLLASGLAEKLVAGED